VVTSDASLEREQLLELILRSDKTYELLNAYPNEILPAVDVRRQRTATSFQGLSATDKEAVYRKFQELIPPRPVPAVAPNPAPALVNDGEKTRGSCTDGLDNDSDGLIDNAESDCKGFFEENGVSLCQDRIDNDRDGQTDQADPDCAQFYLTEVPPPPAGKSTSTSPAPVAPTSTLE
jgi:hypothetical protein